MRSMLMWIAACTTLNEIREKCEMNHRIGMETNILQQLETTMPMATRIQSILCVQTRCHSGVNSDARRIRFSKLKCQAERFDSIRDTQRTDEMSLRKLFIRQKMLRDIGFMFGALA